MKEAITQIVTLGVRRSALAGGLAACLLALTSCDQHHHSAAEILAQKGVALSPAALLQATQENQTYLIGLLTEAGVSADEARDAAGHSALMLAARHGYTEATQVLTPHSQDLDLVDQRGMTALAHAICNDHLEIAAHLLEAGAAADTNCHTRQALLTTTVMRSQLAATELLLNHGAKKGIDDALLIAVTEGKLAFTKRLVAAGASPDAGADFQMPVLNIAMQTGDDRCVDLLLEAGADPNSRDDESMSALGYAIGDGDGELVAELLREGAELELPCQGELTPMEQAVACKDPEILKLLLAGGGAVIHPRVVTNAVDQGSPEVLAVLLDHGADIDTPDSRGDTLLARAIRAGDLAQVRLRLRRGADPHSKSREGQAMIAFATALQRPDCIVALIEAGADPNTKLTDPISNDFRELVGSRTFSFYSKRDKRFTPLMVAASHGHGDTVRALKQNGASSSHYTRGYKRYPISFASEAKNIEAQQLIVGYDPLDRQDAYKIVIDLSSQRAVMYKNGEVHMSSRVSTGKSGYRTPTGTYVVTHKHRTWTSTLYDSPMPYFMRLSCKAFGTHVGHVPNYPASHGCIRMPYKSARAFFNTAPRGTPVSIVH